MRLKRLSAIVAGALLAMLLASCGGGDETTSTFEQSLAKPVAPPTTFTIRPEMTDNGQTIGATVSLLTQDAKGKLPKNVSQYGFKVTVQGGAAALSNVAVTLVAVESGAAIVDGEATIGELAAGTSVLSSDTVVVTSASKLVLNPSTWTWHITATAAPPSGGGGLDGDPAANAAQAVRDRIVDRSAVDKEFVVDPATGVRFQRTQITATLNPSATVGEVNAALQANGASIVFMQEGSTFITLQVPAVESFGALLEVAKRLKASGAFDSASPVVPRRPSRLPSNLTPADAQIACGAAYHHAAVKLPAAWNAVRDNAPADQVEVIIIDYFELTRTSDAVCATVEQPASHGWHVEGILLGDFGGANTLFGKVTGALAIPLNRHRIDLSSVPAPLANEDEFVSRELTRIFRQGASKRFVINLSIEWTAETFAWLTDPANAPDALAFQNDAATRWRKIARDAGKSLAGGYEGKVVQVSSAGNYTGAAAITASDYNRSALADSPGSSRLQNGIVVENRQVIPGTSTTAPTPGCLHSTSSTGGTIGAIGTDVLSYISESTTGYMTGTSMASPQVAGTAALMLAIAPRRTVRDVIDALHNNAVADGCEGASPVLDAYASVLAMDETLGLDTGELQSMPARLSIFHPSAVGQLSVQDFNSYVDALFTPNTAPSYSRFDLNGDGIVGGTQTARFNLDMNLSTQPVMGAQYTSPPRASVVGGPNLISSSGSVLNENLATDFEILCYYAGSKLFGGTAADVTSKLAAKSTEIGRTITCADLAAVLKVNTTNPGWTGLPATISVSGLTQTTIPLFQVLGDPMNSCGSGERGGPIFSASVDPAAAFYSATIVTGLPLNIGGAGINRRPCSSFVARATYPPLVQEQVWINATGRGETFGSTSFDWEIQVRYTNGDPRAGFAGAQCKVGVVPNSGVYISDFDAACEHQLAPVKILQ